jgi:hypothetical protein
MSRLLLLTCLVLCVVVAVAGCGGSCGGGGGGNGIKLAPGTVSLPASAAVSLSECSVATAGGIVTVGTDGKFVAREPGGGPATIALLSASGKIVLLGHVDADNPSFNELSPMSTAEELLFAAMMAYALPLDQWPRLYELIAEAPQTATVADVIASRIAANPTAVGDQDAQIVAAVAAARAAIAPPVSAESAGARGAGASAAQTRGGSSFDVVTEASPPALSVNVVSANPPGLFVLPSEDGQGIIIQNWFRVHREYFVYQTEYTDSGGITHSINPWSPVVSHGFLPAVSGVTGTVSAIIDYYSGATTPWANKQTPTIALPLTPADSTKNKFKVYVVGAGLPVAIPGDLGAQASLAADVASGENRMMALEWFREAICPILFKFLPTTAIAKLTGEPEKTIALANNLITIFSKYGMDLYTDMRNGDTYGAIVDAVQGVVGNSALQAAVLQQLVDTLKAEGETATASTVASAGSKFFAILAAVDIVLTGSDVGKVIIDIGRSDILHAWDVNTLAPKAHLSPKTAALGGGDYQDFLVNVDGGLGALGTLEYHYSCSKGTMADTKGHAGKSFDSSDAGVKYQAPLIVTEGETDTVTATVTLNVHSTRYDIGTDSATVTFTTAVSYIISGSADGSASWSVDDDLDVFINDSTTPAYSDGDALSGTRGPFTITAKKGDTLKVQVRDTYGHCTSLQPLYITDALRPSNNAKITDGFSQGCGLPGWNRGVQFTTTFTIPF